MPTYLLSSAFASGLHELPPEFDAVTLGRSQKNDVPLPNRNVSRRHAKLIGRDGGVWLQDLGSSNGTRVNGDRVSAPHQLHECDLVVIGPYRLQFRCFETVEAAHQAAMDLAGATRRIVAAGLPVPGRWEEFDSRRLHGIYDMLRSLKRTGVLVIQGADGSGEVAFADGELVRATCGAFMGQGAVESLLRVAGGRLKFVDSDAMTPAPPSGRADPRGCEWLMTDSGERLVNRSDWDSSMEMSDTHVD